VRRALLPPKELITRKFGTKPTWESHFSSEGEIVVRKTALLIALVFAVSGCATTTLDSKSFKSYTVGATKTVTIGDPFLADQKGSIRTVRQWVGILNSPDGWRISKVASEDYIRKELLYSGKSANTIKVSYREFRGGFAAPAFSQNLEYDLNESKMINFQRFTLEVVSATNQTITYRIISD
jgi:hypothetical protein